MPKHVGECVTTVFTFKGWFDKMNFARSMVCTTLKLNNKWTSSNCASEIAPKTSYKQKKHNAVSKHPVFILIKSMTYKLQKRDIIKNM